MANKKKKKNTWPETVPVTHVLLYVLTAGGVIQAETLTSIPREVL